MVLPANLAVQQVNDATPGTVPRIPGPDLVLQSSPDGSGAIWAVASSTGGGGVTLQIATVISANVADLANAPATNDGYAIATGDVVALANQSNPANNKLYTATVGAHVVLVPNNPQPVDGTLLLTTHGVFTKNTPYVYRSGSISPVGTSSGVLVGAHGTLITYAPDPAGGSLKEGLNEGIDIQTVNADGNFHTIAQFDCVSRNVTTGSVTFIALVKILNGAHLTRARVECEFFAGAPPTQLCVVPADINDDTSGNGGYLSVQFVITGNAVQLQAKNNQGSAVVIGGFMSIGALAP